MCGLWYVECVFHFKMVVELWNWVCNSAQAGILESPIFIEGREKATGCGVTLMDYSCLIYRYQIPRISVWYFKTVNLPIADYSHMMKVTEV